VADQVGVSRKTLERVELLKQKTPGVLQKVLEGELSVAGAYRALRTEENAKLRAEETPRSAVGTVKSLECVYGKYRTVYLDPPWESQKRKRGSTEQLGRLPLRELAHKDGCHFWIWTPWPIIRKGVIHELLTTWQIRWVAELLWDRGSRGKGRWFHKRTEVLILGAAGTPTLLKTDVEPILTAGSQHGGKGKVDGFRGLIELLSSEPRMELLCSAPHEKWDCWEGRGFCEVNSCTNTITSGNA
jgi:N6-adenosine-specific RNA methylase IME4